MDLLCATVLIFSQKVDVIVGDSIMHDFFDIERDIVN